MTWSGTTSRPPTAPSGKIDKASVDTSTAYLVVDTGPWIFGKKPGSSPPGRSTSVATNDHNVPHLAMSKDQIKGAPDYDANDLDDEAQLKHGDYYRSSGF